VTQTLSDDGEHHSRRPHPRGSVRRASGFVLTSYPYIEPATPRPFPKSVWADTSQPVDFAPSIEACIPFPEPLDFGMSIAHFLGVSAIDLHMPTFEYLSGSTSDLAIIHELTARPVSSLIACEQMNLAGVREWTCRRKSDHWQAGHGTLAQAISLMSTILGFDSLWHTACWPATQCSCTLRTMSLGWPWQDCFGMHWVPPLTDHAPQRLPFLLFAKHRLDIVQPFVICRSAPFNGRGPPGLDLSNYRAGLKFRYCDTAHGGLRHKETAASDMSSVRVRSKFHWPREARSKRC
jgi:hypothetical protein